MLKSAQDLLKILSRSKEQSLHIFNLDKLDIFRQLTFEEFIYRNISPNSHNSAFFLVNNHKYDRAVIFGLSGTPKDFIKDFDFCRKNDIKLIKRFSGGGTVLIDENSLTSSLIATHSFAPGLKANQICKWTFDNIYFPCKLFKNNFTLVDGDYVMKSFNNSNSLDNHQDNNNRIEYLDRENTKDNNNFIYHKVGGNAQAYSKDSFVHHTSFIWTISPLIDKVLNIPKRAPKYRDNRDHSNFLTSVSNVLKNPSMDKDSFAHLLRDSLASNTNLFNSSQTQFHFNFKYVSKLETKITNTHSHSLSLSQTQPQVHFTNTPLNELYLFDDSFIDSCVNSLDKSNTTYLSY